MPTRTLAGFPGIRAVVPADAVGDLVVRVGEEAPPGPPVVPVAGQDAHLGVVPAPDLHHQLDALDHAVPVVGVHELPPGHRGQLGDRPAEQLDVAGVRCLVEPVEVAAAEKHRAAFPPLGQQLSLGAFGRPLDDVRGPCGLIRHPGALLIHSASSRPLPAPTRHDTATPVAASTGDRAPAGPPSHPRPRPRRLVRPTRCARRPRRTLRACRFPAAAAGAPAVPGVVGRVTRRAVRTRPRIGVESTPRALVLPVPQGPTAGRRRGRRRSGTPPWRGGVSLAGRALGDRQEEFRLDVPAGRPLHPVVHAARQVAGIMPCGSRMNFCGTPASNCA